MSISTKRRIRNTGFILLFSLLISSILLATGLGISRLMVRQINLASLSRESQIAFFAADSGLECALHWDKLTDAFLAAPDQASLVAKTIYCNHVIIRDGQSKILHGSDNKYCPDNSMGSPSANNIRGETNIKGKTISCFSFSLKDDVTNTDAETNFDPAWPCAFVVVDTSDPDKTVITSNGFNKCDLNAPKILQRTLEISLVNR